MELLVVIGVAAVMLGAGTLLLHRLLGVERTLALDARTQMTLSRLSERWRDDAHQADRAEVIPPTPARRQFRFRHADREILWTWENGRLAREALQNNKRLAWNDFILAPRTDMKFDFEKTPGIARLMITRPWPGPLTNSEQITYERESPVELPLEAYCRNLKP